MSTQVAYSFDDSITSLIPDQSGYLVDLTASGGVSAVGHTSGGMDCTNGGGKGQLPTQMYQGSGGLQNRAGSWAMWVKTTGSSATEQVLFQVQSASSTWGNSDDIVLWASRGDGVLALQWQGIKSLSANLYDGEWHYVSVQTQGDLSSGGLVVKVDDTVVYSDTSTGTTATLTNGAFALGQSLDNARHFQGIIDDFRLLNDPIDSAGLGTSNAEFMNTPVVSLLDAQFTFDEGTGLTAFDSSGYNHNFTLTSGSWVTGKHGDAIDISGEAISTPLGVADIDAGSSPRWTLMLWFFSSMVTAATNDVYSIAQVTDTSGNLRAEMLIHAEDGVWGMYPRVYDSAFEQWYSTSYHSSIPQDGAWHHLAITVFPTGARTYVDGNPLDPDSNNLASNAHENWDVLSIGGNRFASPDNAQIDDLRLVSNYLYGDAIERHMASANAAPPILHSGGVDVSAAGTVALAGTKDADAVLSILGPSSIAIPQGDKAVWSHVSVFGTSSISVVGGSTSVNVLEVIGTGLISILGIKHVTESVRVTGHSSLTVAGSGGTPSTQRNLTILGTTVLMSGWSTNGITAPWQTSGVVAQHPHDVSPLVSGWTTELIAN